MFQGEGGILSPSYPLNKTDIIIMQSGINYFSCFSLEGPLPNDHYLSFFSVVKEAFEPLNDRKGELGKVSFDVIMQKLVFHLNEKCLRWTTANIVELRVGVGLIVTKIVY